MAEGGTADIGGRPGVSADGNRRRAIVLLAEFQDLQFTYGVEDFKALLSHRGYDACGTLGCAEEWFAAQFGSACSVSFDVAPIVRLPYKYAYYGLDDPFGKDIRPAHAVRAACDAADEFVDFSAYDDLIVFYAGGSAIDGCSDEDHLWPHNWFLSKAGLNVTLDGVNIDRYALCPELMKGEDGNATLTGIGLVCHEYLHSFGLPDMYDTDDTQSGGVGTALGASTSVMDQGMFNRFGHLPPNLNALEREMLGILKPDPLVAGDYTVMPVNAGGKSYRYDTAVPGEYFLFECRDDTGWDAPIGRRGLMVYHIDKSQEDVGGRSAASRWEYDINAVNACPHHQCALLVEPSSEFTPVSTPSFKSWSGRPSPLSILDIRRNPDGSVSFHVPEAIELEAADVFQDAVILQWYTPHRGLSAETTYVSVDGEKILECHPYEPGRYACVIEGLQPGRDYELSVCFETEVVRSSVTVTTLPAGGYPFIALPRAGRKDSGAFEKGARLPLRVVNAEDVERIDWFMDGRKIEVGPDCYFSVQASAELKAVIRHIGGAEETIVKTIRVQ